MDAAGIGRAAGGFLENIATAARAGRGTHVLSEPEVSLLVLSANGLDPDAKLVADLAAEGVQWGGKVIDNVPGGGGAAGGTDLIGAIRDGIRNELDTLVSKWKDARFPDRLENALHKQEELLPKLRQTLLTQESAVTNGNNAIQKLSARLATLEEEAKAAVEKGDNDTATRVLGLKINLKTELDNIVQRTTKYADDVKTTKSQITTLESKISIDRDKAGLLLAEWRAKKQLSELSDAAKSAMNDLNSLEADALKNARQADMAAEAARNSVDDLLRGGGVRVPGGGSTPTVPGAPTVPVVDDAVQKELDRIRQELGRNTPA